MSIRKGGISLFFGSQQKRVDWIRFKNVGGAKFHHINFDYLEIVPLNIISDPLKPEDRH